MAGEHRKLTRRRLLQAGAGLAAGGAVLVPVVGALRFGGGLRTLRAEELTHDRLVPLGGRTIKVLSGDGATVTSLGVKSVSNVTAYDGPEAAGEVFSVDMEGPARWPVEQGTYEFADAELGRFPMFLVPVGPSDDRVQSYQAVFNRLA